MPKFIVKNTKTQEEQIHNLPQDTITLGRTSLCDVELADKSISRKHAEIVRDGEDFFLIDLKSGNGTLLNNKKIRPLEKHLLRPNDLIKIEFFEICFLGIEDDIQKPVEEDTDTDIIEIKMIKKVLKALDKDNAPSLEVLNGVAAGKKVFFTEEFPVLDIGRDPKSKLCIDEAVISRNHAKLTRKWGGVVLEDLDSRNGCYVNNEKIKEQVLKDGDKVLLGTVKLIYRNPQDVNIEAISQEIARKKKEAVLREAELMEAQKISLEESNEENADAPNNEEANPEAQDSTEGAPVPETAVTPPPPSPTPPTETAAPPIHTLEGLSLAEKALIGGGLFIVLLALLGIFYLLF